VSPGESNVADIDAIEDDTRSAVGKLKMKNSRMTL